MPDKQEQKIVDGLRAGDAQAWSELYEAHAKRVWHEVQQRLGAGASDVADVVQEVFLDAARAAGSYRSQSGTLSQWLNGIVRRKIALYWRHRQRHDRIASEEVSRLFCWLDGDMGDPPAIVESAELVQAIRETLRQLPEDYERVLRSKYASGHTAQQIAEAMNTSVDAVNSKLKRARQQFRDKFSRQYESTPQRAATYGPPGT